MSKITVLLVLICALMVAVEILSGGEWAAWLVATFGWLCLLLEEMRNE